MSPGSNHLPLAQESHENDENLSEMDEYSSFGRSPAAGWWRASGCQSASFERPGELRLQATELTSDGVMRSVKLSRKELTATSGICARELRSLLLVGNHLPQVTWQSEHMELTRGSMLSNFSTKRSIIFSLRDSALLLSLGSIRGIVEPSRVLLFRRAGDIQDVSFGDGGRGEFLSTLRKSLSESNGAGNFIIRCADIALVTVVSQLDIRIRQLRRLADPVINAEKLTLKEVELEQIRQHRSSLVKCAAEASDVCLALLACLNGNDGSSAECMVGDAHVEWETMVESYLQAYSECYDECARLLGRIDDFERSTSLAIQARRLHIEEFELSLVIGAVSIAAGAIVPGWMGMNVPNFYESSDHAFKFCVFMTLLVSNSVYFGVRCLAQCRGVFS